jgi:hypothetical protein
MTGEIDAAIALVLRTYPNPTDAMRALAEAGAREAERVAASWRRALEAAIAPASAPTSQEAAQSSGGRDRAGRSTAAAEKPESARKAASSNGAAHHKLAKVKAAKKPAVTNATIVKFRGRDITVGQLARENVTREITFDCIASRMKRRWDAQRAISEPPDTTRRGRKPRAAAPPIASHERCG